MSDFAAAEYELRRSVDRAVSPRHTLESFGRAFVRVATDAVGTGVTEAIVTDMFRDATARHARRRGRVG